MTLSAAKCQSQPNRGGRIHTVDHVFDLILLGNHASLGVAPVVAIKTACDSLVERGRWEPGSGDLLDCELVKRHVLIEGFNHPIAPPPHIARPIGLVAARVGIPGQVEPAHGHPLGVPF